jgi:hypothetical protein
MSDGQPAIRSFGCRIRQGNRRDWFGLDRIQEMARVKAAMQAGAISAAVLGILSAMAIAVIVIIICRLAYLEIVTLFRPRH